MKAAIGAKSVVSGDFLENWTLAGDVENALVSASKNCLSS